MASSFLPEGSAPQGVGRKATERPSGLDEPPVFRHWLERGTGGLSYASHANSVRDARDPCAKSQQAQCPLYGGHPHWGLRGTYPDGYLRYCTSWGTSGGGDLVIIVIRITGVNRNTRRGHRRQYVKHLWCRVPGLWAIDPRSDRPQPRRGSSPAEEPERASRSPTLARSARSRGPGATTRSPEDRVADPRS